MRLMQRRDQRSAPSDVHDTHELVHGRSPDHGGADQGVPHHPRPGHRCSFNYEMAKQVPAFEPREREADGTYRMDQVDIDRGQEFHKCIECFLCQNVCHVIRDHEENKEHFAGPRLFIRYAELEMHPLDVNDRRDLLQDSMGLGMCNITKCCTEVCPENISITDNAIIPLKERVASKRYDPIMWLGRKIRPKP